MASKLISTPYTARLINYIIYSYEQNSHAPYSPDLHLDFTAWGKALLFAGPGCISAEKASRDENGGAAAMNSLDIFALQAADQLHLREVRRAPKKNAGIFICADCV